ncbi:Tn3 family transposase, partial [Thiotrichales bacterium 19S11-10]|nr:Tn3 family transposase [Thiotrichales bacterium 19S11-10]
MPVKFLTNEQINSYAAFPESLEDEHLAKYCYLDDTDKRLISDCRRDYNKLGYALQLVTVRLIGRFLPNPVEVPDAIRSFVTIQLHISAPVDLSKYLERKATRLKHCDEIKHTFGYSEFNNHWYFVLARWLYYQAWFGDDRPSILFEKTVNWLISKKILLPGISTLDRLISKIRDRAKKRLWLKLSKTVNDEQTQQLIKLLNIPKGKRYSKLDELKNGPTRISSSGLMYGLSRYQFIREIAVRQSKFSHIPKPKIAQLARYVKTSWAPSVARMSKNHKLAVLVAFAYVYEIKALDDALDLLDMLITEIVAKAVKAGKKKEERTRGDLDKAAIRLCELASLFIKHEHDADLTDKIYSQLPKQSIVSSVEMVQTLTRKHHDKYYQELVEQYKTVRRFLPHLLKSITFESTQAGKPIKEIMNFLLAAEQRRKTNFNDAPKTIITPGWRDVVYKEDADTVDRAGYTLCAVDSLQTYLRSRDLYVPESKNWSDPRAKLISGEEWRQQGHLVCKSLNLSLDPEKMLDVLAERLDVAYKSVAERLPENQYANIAKKSNGKYQLKLGRLKASDESESLTWLVETVSDLMPNVDLPELLLEVDRITKFTQAFPNVNNFNSQLENINVSLCAILMAEGCNIELSQVEKRGVAALKYSRLSWVEQNCVDAENLLNGNAILVDYHTNHPMAKKMGTGHIVSGDGLRFTVAVDSVYSAPNKKYFPQGKRGVTYYGLTNDQCASLHGLVITGTLRDSLFLLDSL